MCSVPIKVPTAAERAQWLAEVAEALKSAQQLVASLNVNGERRADALELYLRIEAARLEIQSLQLSRHLQPRSEIAPKWTGLQPWAAGSRES
jgi:hypothetical protein